MGVLKTTLLISLITCFLWILIDLAFTNILDVRGFSKFFKHDEVAGRINKPNFSGYFGGPLNDFYSKVNIGKYGERVSSNIKCDEILKKIIFLGDSTTAGFEVNDQETFVSKINENCNKNGVLGYNFAVRANDTHSVIASYKKIKDTIPHSDVFYLITQNDFKENLNIFEYYNMTLNFGRVFNQELLEFKITNIKKKYINLRIFINDKFYFSSQIFIYINSLFSNLKIKNKEKNLIKKTDNIAQTTKEFKKMINLLELLSSITSKKNTNLAVGLYPCLSLICEDKYSHLLRESLNQNSKIEYIPVYEAITEMIKKECFKPEKLRFKRDSHLSKFGHLVVSEVLNKYYLKEQNNNYKSIC